MTERRPPGQVRDAILAVFRERGGGPIRVRDIQAGVRAALGDVPPSSVRSFLNIQTPTLFERLSKGTYRLRLP
jgi:site-specific DNA-methyltransferase (adenine-specific)